MRNTIDPWVARILEDLATLPARFHEMNEAERMQVRGSLARILNVGLEAAQIAQRDYWADDQPREQLRQEVRERALQYLGFDEAWLKLPGAAWSLAILVARDLNVSVAFVIGALKREFPGYEVDWDVEGTITAKVPVAS